MSVKRLRAARWLRLILTGLGYLLIAGIIIGANPFKGETTGPFDLLASYPGWNPEGKQVDVRHGARSDVLDSLLPEWVEASRQLQEGYLPLWNPLPAGGRAGLVDPTRALVTPAFFAFAAAPDPELGFYLATLVNLCIAGFGMHMLVNRYQTTLASVFAGTSYMMSGFFAGWLFWPHITTAIWLPWLLLFIALELREHRGWTTAAIAVTVALMFMGGFPFVMALALGYGALVVAFDLSSRWWSCESERASLRSAGWVGLAVLLGLGLVCLPLLSLYSMLGNADLGYRSGGSPLSLLAHGKLLLQPWAGAALGVESSMYVGMLALVLAVPGTIRALLRPRSLLGVSAVALAIVGVLLTFGILPDWIGSRVPVLSSNPWSRAIILLNVAIILLAAIGLDALVATRRSRNTAVAVGIALTCIQFSDLLHQFRKFNGPTEGGYFYNTAKIVEELPESLNPFEYVAQDGRVMMISGTTGAVGLRDWFAHSMRSAELHNLLDAMAEDPFNSPTSTLIPGTSYHWERPIMDITATCYLIGASATFHGPILLQPQNGERFPVGPVNSTVVAQEVVLDRSVAVGAVTVRMATYHERGLAGYVDLRLVDLDSGSDIATSRVDAQSISDNGEIAFEFAAAADLRPGRYQLLLRYEPMEEERRLAFWAVDVPGASFAVDGAPRSGAISYTLRGPADGHLLLKNIEDGVAIYENPGCLKGAYWTEDPTDPLMSASVEPIRVVGYKPHDFHIEVETGRAGFLIVPMNLLPGWRFYVNDVEVEPIRLAGVMPAVPVSSGTSSVRGAYMPPHMNVGLVVTFLSTVLLALTIGLDGFRARRQHGVVRE